MGVKMTPTLIFGLAVAIVITGVAVIAARIEKTTMPIQAQRVLLSAVSQIAEDRGWGQFKIASMQKGESHPLGNKFPETPPDEVWCATLEIFGMNANDRQNGLERWIIYGDKLPEQGDIWWNVQTGFHYSDFSAIGCR